MKKVIISFLVAFSLAVSCNANAATKHNTYNQVVNTKDCKAQTKSKNKGGKKNLCKPVKFNKPHKLYVKYKHSQNGYASWYGGKFIGRKTASGEIFSAYKLTAAHKTLPLGTIVKVTNNKTNSVVIVRINDRGPLKPNRIVDLSPSAAREIGLHKVGVMPITLEVISTPR